MFIFRIHSIKQSHSSVLNTHYIVIHYGIYGSFKLKMNHSFSCEMTGNQKENLLLFSFFRLTECAQLYIYYTVQNLIKFTGVFTIVISTCSYEQGLLFNV